MINKLKQYSEDMWIQDELTTVETSYQQHLREQRIILQDGKLIILKPIFQNVRFISLIIVHTSLRANIFSHYHDSTTCGHMGESKSLFSLCLWFPWTSLQKNLKEWVKGYDHCVAHNVLSYRKSKLYFSWPVTMPFYIMHVNI